MPIFSITSKATGQEVYRYETPTMTIWDNFPQSDYDYAQVPADPVPVVTYNGSWRITKLAFRNRFTTNEKVAIEIAALDNPQASMQSRALSAALRASQADLNVATYIDLKRADTRAGVQQLEGAGLLASGRSAIILDTIPIDDELYHGQ